MERVLRGRKFCKRVPLLIAGLVMLIMTGTSHSAINQSYPFQAVVDNTSISQAVINQSYPSEVVVDNLNQILGLAKQSCHVAYAYKADTTPFGKFTLEKLLLAPVALPVMPPVIIFAAYWEVCGQIRDIQFS